MTRKQYVRKMMQVQRNIEKYAKENGLKPSKKSDRVGAPKWGTIIQIGSHKGERLSSYSQAWDIITETLKGTTFLEGIK